MNELATANLKGNPVDVRDGDPTPRSNATSVETATPLIRMAIQ
jgi:hypothetical protein